MCIYYRTMNTDPSTDEQTSNQRSVCLRSLVHLHIVSNYTKITILLEYAIQYFTGSGFTFFLKGFKSLRTYCQRNTYLESLFKKVESGVVDAGVGLDAAQYDRLGVRLHVLLPSHTASYMDVIPDPDGSAFI